MITRLTLLLAVLMPALAPAAPAPSAAPTSSTVVFVPYEKANGPKLGPGQSVLLPYAEFLRLRGTAAGQATHPEFRPVASLAQAAYQGEVKGDVATLEAQFVIEALARPADQLEIRLPFGNVAVESAAVEGPKASLGALEEGVGFRVFLTGEGRRTLKLKLATRLGADGVKRWTDFNIPRAAAASIALKTSDDAVLEREPLALPATIEPAPGGGSLIKASAGASDRVLLAWRPRVKATGVAAQARLAVDQQMSLALTARGAEARVKLAATLLAGQTATLPLELPAGVRLLGVSGPFVKDWSAPDAQRRVNVALAREVSQPFEVILAVQMDTAATTAAAERLSVPEFRVPGAVQETGSILIAPEAGLSIWPERTDGLEAVSTTGEESGVSRKFHFSQPGWRLALTRRPMPARIRVSGATLYEITDELIRLKSRQGLTIGGRGIFSVTLLAPQGYELREAGPAEIVSGFRQQGRRVEINFRGEQAKGCTLELTFQRAGTTTGATLTVEPVSVEGADENSGSLVVAMPLALRATEQGSSGMEAADIRSLLNQIGPLLSGDIEPVLGYKYYTPSASARALIERQRTRLTCETALLATINPSLLRMDATLNYNVEFSATDVFLVMVPSLAGEDVRFSGADIKEKSHAPRKSEVPSSDLTTWTVRLQRRVLGPYQLGVSFDTPLTAAAAGKSQSVAVPRVKAAGVARETGYLAVARGENLEVKTDKAEGLEVRDVKELPAALASAYFGFRYYDPDRAALSVTLTRHDAEGVLEALVRRMHIETVLSDERKAIHEAIFEIQNNNRQYLELKLPEGMKIWSAFVRGVPVRSTTRQSDGASLIELTKSESMDSAFRVRLILHQDLPGGAMGKAGKLRFDPPQPLGGIPVLRTTWKLYLPRGYRYVGFGGTMRQESGGERPWIEPAAEKLLNDIPAGLAGGVARPGQNPHDAALPVAYDAAATEAEKKALVQGTALEVPIVREGLQFEFSKLSGTGTIEVSYWKSKGLVTLQLVLGVIIFALLMPLMLRGRRLGVGLAAVVISFILTSLTEGLAGRLCATALAVSAVALVIGCVIYEARLIRGRLSTIKSTQPAASKE